MKQLYSQRHSRLREILKKARLDAGLTQQQLCRRLKRDRNFVSAVEIGIRMLDALELAEYCEALRIDPVENYRYVLYGRP